MTSLSRPLSLVGVALLLLSCLAIPFTEGQQVPSVAVDIIEDSALADTSLGKGVVIRFHGNVSVSGDLPTTVKLEAFMVDEDWDVSINPNALVPVPGTGVVDFDGTVGVPAYAIGGNYILKVNATVETGIPTPITKHDTMTIMVVSNRISVEVVDPGEITIEQSNMTENFVFSFKVFNKGSTDDSVSFTLTDRWNMRDKGWTLGLPSDDIKVQAGAFIYVNLNVSIPAFAEVGSYEFYVKAGSTNTNSYSEDKAMVNVIGPPPVGQPKDDTWSFLGLGYTGWFMVSLAMVGVFMVVFLGGTEIGFFAFLIYLLVPLYCRIKKEKVLDNFTRGQIFGYIKANPGAHYMEIQNHLEITNGVLAHHLKVLEREEFVKVHRDGFYKRFYPKHVKISKRGKHLSRIQKDMVEEIERHPGINQRNLSKYLGESKQVISYHVKVLSKVSLIRVEKDGGHSRLFSSRSHRARTKAVDEQGSRFEEDGVAIPDAEPMAVGKRKDPPLISRY